MKTGMKFVTALLGSFVLLLGACERGDTTDDIDRTPPATQQQPNNPPATQPTPNN